MEPPSEDGARSPTTEASAALRVDPRLLEVLVCPVTRKPLEWNRIAGVLISRQAGLAYPIRDGIPIMLAEEASPVSDDQ